jgi:polar amino acid transport system permease protein
VREASIQYQLQFGPVFAQSDLLIHGLSLTLELTAIAVAAGFLIGIIGGAIRSRGPKWAARCVAAYVELIRNTPFLVQLFFVFLALPQIGDMIGLPLRLAPMTAAAIALSVNLGGFAVEIVRAGIDSIPQGQVEAAQSLGLRPLRIFQKVILPPAIASVYPSLTSQFILTMLGSSIVSAISVDELTGAATEIQSENFRTFETYLVVTVIYFLLAVVMRMVLWGIAHATLPHYRRAGSRG